MTFRFEQLQPVQIKLTGQIGWVIGRSDMASGAQNYLVTFQNAAGEYSQRWFWEYEIAATAAQPPGLSYPE